MPTTSIISACISKFAGLTASIFPGGIRPVLYFDEAPAVNASGTQINAATAGYVVMHDRGQDVKLMGFERQTNEVCTFEMEVFYPLLGDVDTAVLAIKRNGGTAVQALGFDFGTLSDLQNPRGTFEIVRTKEQRSFAGMGKLGTPVHLCKITYRVVVSEAP